MSLLSPLQFSAFSLDDLQLIYDYYGESSRCIYVLEWCENTVKVGYSNMIAVRLSRLKNKVIRPGIVYIARVPGRASEYETAAHYILRDHRIGGSELFMINGSDCINRLTTLEYQQPILKYGKTLGRLLNDVITAKGITQKEIVEKTGLNSGKLSSFLNFGDACKLKFGGFEQLCDFVGIEPEVLYQIAQNVQYCED